MRHGEAELEEVESVDQHVASAIVVQAAGELHLRALGQTVGEFARL